MNRKTLILLGSVLLLSTTVMAQPSAENVSDVNPGITPGHPLYVVESFVENIEVKMAGMIGGPELKSKAIANNAEERLAEARKLADRNKTEKAAKAMQKYSEGLNQSRQIAKDTGNRKLQAQIENVSQKNTKVLEEVKKKVPEQARDAIKRAQDNSGIKQKPDVQNRSQGNADAPENLKKGLNNSKPEEKPVGDKRANKTTAPGIVNKTGENLKDGNLSSKSDTSGKNGKVDERNSSEEIQPRDSDSDVDQDAGSENREEETSNGLESGSEEVTEEPQDLIQ